MPNLTGLVLIAAGFAMVIWTMAMHFNRSPDWVQFEPTPSFLLIRGPYVYTRNPMYVAVLTLWLGWALLYGSLAVLAGWFVLAALMQFLFIPREERALEKRFGDAYRDYKQNVPRWFAKF